MCGLQVKVYFRNNFMKSYIFQKKSQKIEKMELKYDHAFNVDPNDFIGFKSYKITSNVDGKIYAMLTDNTYSNM